MKLIITTFTYLIFQVGFSQDLPINPKPGKCYARCIQEDGEIDAWKEVECNLLRTQELPLELYKTNGVLTEKDKKVIKKRLISILNDGYAIQIKSHFDSKEIDSIDIHRSVQIGNIIGNYLLSQNINPMRLVVSGYGNSEPFNKCPDNEICADWIYKKNTRIEYRVISKPQL